MTNLLTRGLGTTVITYVSTGPIRIQVANEVKIQVSKE